MPTTALAPSSPLPAAGTSPALPYTPYRPAPGTEYPFSIGDLAMATADRLKGWDGFSTPWGVSGRIFSQDNDVYDLSVENGDLYLSRTFLRDGVFEAELELPTTKAADGLFVLALRLAKVIAATSGAELTDPSDAEAEQL
jgi:hypothetical protein